MAVDREFEFIVWRPAFVSGALHVHLGAASLEKTLCFGRLDVRKLNFPLIFEVSRTANLQKPCAFEGPHAELPRGSPIQ